MNLTPDEIPMLWPSGPLAAARRRQAEGFTPELKTTLDRWHQPQTLDLLQSSPITCLVLPWASGLPEDKDQWQSSTPLVQAARKRNLKIVGWIEEKADASQAVAAARAAGLTAVAAPAGFQGNAEMPALPWAERGHLPWDSKAPALLATGNAWPGVQAQQGGASEAGPTGKPWVESNAWFVELARLRTPAAIWLMFDPPAGSVLRQQSYVVAVMDAEAKGGRWVLSFDENLRRGLVEGSAAAAQTASTVWNTLRFFAKHRDWGTMQSLALVGILSDYSQANFEMAGEVLKLTARRGLLTRPVWASQAAQRGFAGLKAIVCYDEELPPAALRKRVLDFVAQGNLLIAGPKWGPIGKASASHQHPRYDIQLYGKGRAAIARANVVDPYEAAIDIHGLFSRANDLVRLFNTATSGGLFYAGTPDGKRTLLQLVNYTAGGGRGNPAAGTPNVTVWVRRNYRAARMWTMETAEPAPLTAVPADSGYEYHIAALPPYAAIEFEA
ncbi:MAG: hypothetical protein ACUVXB_05485 [Bryobacteraceae bacterium]